MSLLLCVAAGALWVWSLSYGVGFARHDPSATSFGFLLSRGAVHVSIGPPERTYLAPGHRPGRARGFRLWHEPANWFRPDELVDVWHSGFTNGSWYGTPSPAPERLTVLPRSASTDTMMMPVRRTEWSGAGFVHQLGLLAYTDDTAVVYARRWRVPAWAVASALLVIGVPPAGLLAHRLRRARLTAGRRRAGCCTACGYDLRATPGRCPECGAEQAR